MKDKICLRLTEFLDSECSDYDLTIQLNIYG